MKDNLYIIKAYNKDGKCLVKLGYSADVERRLGYYLGHNPFTEICGTYYRKDAEAFERYIHKKYTSVYKAEWYDEDMYPVLLNEVLTGVVRQVKYVGKPNYQNYARLVKEVTCKEDLEELLSDIRHSHWVTYLRYGWETGKVLTMFKGAKEHYEKSLIREDVLNKLSKSIKLEVFYTRADMRKILKKAVGKKVTSTTISEFADVTTQATYINKQFVKGYIVHKIGTN